MARSKEAMVKDMFAQIAPTYDLLNTLLSFNIHHGWRRAALDDACLRPGACVLDLATGTADLALGAARRGARVIGADFCAPILRLGQAKVRRLGQAKVPSTGDAGIAFALGSADHLPFADNSFDAVVMGFALRNVPSPERALAEMTRVTRPGGWVVNLDLTRPVRAWLRPLYRFYQNQLMPWVGGLISGRREAYTYLPQSIQGFPPPETIADVFRAAGLVDVSYRPLSGGLATIHRGRKS
ncbi:MAG: class I SAM-dependent methyltransferase [Armatimonadetes bacterium]|nr:class I SAM-dependent methyltransferase [Armatimonadota bacterium]